jgi:hypothetical protein
MSNLYRVPRFKKKYSSLKPLGQMNRNLGGSIYGRSSLKIAYFVSIRYQTWLLTDRNYMCNFFKGPSKDASCQVSIHLAKRFQRRRFFRNQPIRNKNFLWRNLGGSIYGRSSLKIAYFVSIRYQTWPPQTILVSDWLISKTSIFDFRGLYFCAA